MKPLVSIIIPTYNRADFIGETLDSVLVQNHKNWECIVVDDGSTDHTAEVLSSYCKKDSRFQYHQRPKDRPKGANACRNYGFELSCGRYINWFDSDDLMLTNKLSNQVRLLHESIYDYTICQTMMYDIQSNKKIGLRALNLISENIFEDYILNLIFWLTGAPLWKRTFLEKHNLCFDESLHQAQDYDFHMRVLDISENYCVDNDYLVIAKVHENNMSKSTKNSEQKIRSNIIVKQNVLKKYRNKLSKKTLLLNYKSLLAFYKFTLRSGYYILALNAFMYIITNTSILEYNFTKKISLFFKLLLSYVSFFLFNRGEKLLKIEF